MPKATNRDHFQFKSQCLFGICTFFPDLCEFLKVTQDLSHS